MKISEINGSLKIKRIPSRYKTMKEYHVTLYRGAEEKLLEKLNGDLLNLIAFCDNGCRFDDLVARHYGGTVEPYTNNESKKCYRVLIYTD